MSRFFVFTILCFFAVIQSSAQQYRKMTNTAFRRGEKLEYRIAFHSALTGNLTAARATMEVTQDKKAFNNRNTYHVVLDGHTSGLIEVFYKVSEHFESYIDEEALIPFEFIRKTRENNYRKNETVKFDHKYKLAVSNNAVTKVPENVHDMVSILYCARNLDLTNAKKGTVFTLPFLLDDSVYYSKIIYEGKETIKSKLGKVDCIKIKPMVATGDVFKDPFPATLWISDDKNRIPIRIESALTVGSVRVDITAYSGLANSFTSLIKPK